MIKQPTVKEQEPGPSIDVKVENQLRAQKKSDRAERAAMRAALKAERRSKDIAKLRMTPLPHIKTEKPRPRRRPRKQTVKEKRQSIKASLRALDGHPPCTIEGHDAANEVLREAIELDKNNEATPR